MGFFSSPSGAAIGLFSTAWRASRARVGHPELHDTNSSSVWDSQCRGYRQRRLSGLTHSGIVAGQEDTTGRWSGNNRPISGMLT